MPGYRLTPMDCSGWACLFSCTGFGGMPEYSLIEGCIGCHTLNFSVVFYTLSRHAILQIDSIGLFTRFGGMPGYRLTPSDCPHWTCLLCSTSFGRMLGYILIPLDCPHWLEACQGTVWPHIALIECFYYALHVLEAYQGVDWLHWIAHI